MNPLLKTFPKQSLLQFLILLAIGWYLLLCVLHLFSMRPLWNDEECVFRSVQGFSPVDLFTQNLAAFQMFPRVYLFSIQ